MGEKLREARSDKGVSLDKAAKNLGIAFKYLEALENNNLKGLPAGRTYVKNFLKLYAGYLNLDFNDLWRVARELEFRDETGFSRLGRKYFLSWPKFIARALIFLVVLAVVVFLIFKIKAIFAPPFLDIASPEDGLITTSREIAVIGRSNPEVELMINNKIIFVDKEGSFKTSLDLQKGLNLIKITAKKKYGREREVDLRVLLQAE